MSCRARSSAEAIRLARLVTELRPDEPEAAGQLALMQLHDAAIRRGRPGPFQIQAVIAALHAEPRDAEETNWRQIALLYGEGASAGEPYRGAQPGSCSSDGRGPRDAGETRYRPRP